MPHVPVTAHRTDVSLELRRGDHVLQVIDLTQLVEVWLVRVGEGFSGPDEFILVLVGSNTATPLPLEHHAVWTGLLVDMRRLASRNAAFQAQAVRLPKNWLAKPHSLFARAKVLPIARPRAELETACRDWFNEAWTTIPEPMP